MQKNWGPSLNFFAKSAGRCFTPVLEIKHKALVFDETSKQTYSLSEEGFGYNYGCFQKKFSEPQVSVNDGAKEVRNGESRT